MSNRLHVRRDIERKRGEYAKKRREEFRITKHIRRFGPREPVGQYDQRLKRLVIDIPQFLDLEENRAATLEIARACTTNCIIRKRRTLLDFHDTLQISSAAMLYLVAEIDRCRRVGGIQVLNGTFPKDKRLKRQMRDCGFFDALGVTCDMSDKPKVFPLEYIKVQSGSLADGRLARELRVALFGPLEQQIDKGKSKSFFRGLSEAMTNVIHHAYPDDWDPSPIKMIHKGWWMLGHINKLSKQLKIMIVDQGIGIPRSLPRTHREAMRNFFTSWGDISQDDGNLIRAAMQIGRSRVGLSHRGKGLNDLKQIIDICQAGHLRILSKKGEYRYAIKQGKLAEHVRTHETSLNGTLVEWSLPLKAILPFLEMENGEEEK